MPTEDPLAAPPPRRPASAIVGWLGIFWRGAAMGAADVVPGVSGGTMALALGIYARLLVAVGAISRAPLWRALARGRWLLAWRSIDGAFLVAVVAGIATSVVALAGVVESALEVFRPQVYALFLGLIAASVLLVAAEVGRWGLVEVAWLLAAGAAAGVIVGLTPIETPSHPAFLVLVGAIGICAMVLPGVSGAFLLVLMGQYETVLGAIARADLQVLAPFALGAGVGLLAFARALSAWLRHFPGPTHAAMAGFLIGSLRRVWPWQADGALHLTLLAPPDVGAALGGLLLAAGGAAAVLAVAHLGRRRPR